MPRFDTVSFSGGPLDGVCWPCVLNPESLVLRTADGVLHCYEVDRASEYEDGTHDYRMMPTLDLEAFWEEFLAKGKP